MKIVVDRDRCEAHGVCVRLAPEVFQIGADEVLNLRTVPTDHDICGKVAKAVRYCPKDALALIEEE